MAKRFNVTGNCIPEKHYMVDITNRLKETKEMVDRGDYFTINRGRQYGKTTTLHLLTKYLQEQYIVISIDFQNLDSSEFSNMETFVEAFAREFYLSIKDNDEITTDLKEQLQRFANGDIYRSSLRKLFLVLSDCCAKAHRPIVLMIDEVDAASNFQVFLDFLAQLRSGYLHRDSMSTFQSVILAGVYDIKNLKHKFVKEGEHGTNSPWNIATDYLVDMNFSADEIAGMLYEYESDYMTGMNTSAVSQLIYEYTSGYPYLVSRICKKMDEQMPGTDRFPTKETVWTTEGVTETVGRVIAEENTLFDSLTDKVNAYPELRDFLQTLLMTGKEISNIPGDNAIGIAKMFGFVRIENNKVVVANRIFETRLYNMFLSSPEMQSNEMYTCGAREKYQFIKDGELNMDLILRRFVVTFDDLYGDQTQKFIEEDGRRYFLLYLRPIINGTGNYYIESRTRNQERTDVIVDYLGKQYVCELKIWHGDAYNERGEEQLKEYLNHYHLDRGYMLSFNFNKNKKIGVHEIRLGDKILVEAVV
ncbi:MAG: AAA-like domain-containing protein [Clostridiales bacterium]|nr:AAA-like domain-containing protein [Clostridiales bacterium]